MFSKFKAVFGKSIKTGRWCSYDYNVNKEQIYKQKSNLFSLQLPSVNGFEYLKLVPNNILEVYDRDIMKVYTEIMQYSIAEETEHKLMIEEIRNLLMMDKVYISDERISELVNGASIYYDSYRDELFTLNLIRAQEYINSVTEISKDVIVSLWSILFLGCNNQLDQRETVEYTSMTEDYVVNSHMNNLIEFWNSDKLDKIPFIKASLIYYMIRTIHPFCEGNDKIAIMLVTKYLCSKGFTWCKIMPLSKVLNENTYGILNSLKESNNEFSDCTPIIEYMLKMFDDSLHLLEEELYTYTQ